MKTKTPLILTSAVLSMALLTACGGENRDNAAGEAGTAATSATDATVTDPNANAGVNDPLLAEGAGAPMTEADALGAVMASNEHEIAAAEQATSKKVSAPVAEYAKMMVTDHTANMEKARALQSSAGVQAGSGPQVAALRTESEAKRTQLASLEGQEYERAYAEEMVNSHQKTLTLLEQAITSAQNEPVRQFLTETRDAVSKHLEAARQLQTQVSGGTQGDATSGQAQPTPATES